jgi:predicted site-specific integrase-resolvase
VGAPADINTLPLILFDEDLCELLDISLRTLKRQRRLGTFPIPEILPKLDRRHRSARSDVERFLNREKPIAFARRRA